MRNFKAIYLVIITLLGVVFSTTAATITSKTTGGNWSDTSTWVGAVTPTSADYVVINGNVAVAANTTCKAITVNSGKTLTINPGVILTLDYTSIVWNSQPSYTISNAGTVILASGGNNEIVINSSNGQSWPSIINSGTITANSGKITIQRNTNASFFTSTGTFNPGTGIVEFKGSGGESSVSSSLSFNNVVVNNININMNGAAVNGKLQLVNGGNFGSQSGQDTKHPIYGSNAILEINGTYSVSTHTILWATNYASYSNRIAPNIVIASGTLTADQGQLYLKGTFTVNNGATFNGSKGCMFMVSGFQSITNYGTITALGGLTVQNGAVWNVNNNYNLATLKIENGGTVNANSYTLTINNSAINNCGGISGIMQLVAGGTFNPGTGTVVFNPAYWSNVTAEVSGPITFNNFVATGTNPVVIPASSTVNVNGNITVDAGAKVELPQNINYGNDASVTNNGTVTGNTNNFPPITSTPPTNTDLSGIGGGTVNGVATVKTGNTYELNNNLNIVLGAQKILTVAPGAQLIVKDKTVTADTVYVYGKVTISNAGGLSAAFANPTKVVLRSGSTIEYTGEAAQTITPRTDYVNLELKGVGTKNFAAGNYTVSGNLTVQDGAATIASNTNFTFNGSNQNIKGLPFNNVTFSGSGAKTLTDTAKVTGTITVSGTANLVSNGLITLTSNASGTASIGTIASGASITGKVNWERYIPATANTSTAKWKFVAIPLTGLTFSNSIQNQIHITGAGNGTTIGTKNSNGFDATASNSASLYWYDETINAGISSKWKSIASTNDNIIPTRGYRIFVRGNKETQGNSLIVGNSPAPEAVTLKASGYIQQGDITVTFTCSNGCREGIDGWQLVANPYPSAIDWNNTEWVTSRGSNISSTLYIYDPGTNKWATWQNGVPPLNGGNKEIASGQSFYVKANINNASFTFKETYKVSAPTIGHFSKTGDTYANALKIQLGDDNNVVYDEAAVFMRNDASDSIDSYDAVKMGTGVATYTQAYTSPLAYNAIPLLNAGETGTVLFYMPLANSTYTYKLNLIGTESFANQSTRFLLVDAYTNDTVALTTGQPTYSFSTTAGAAASYASNRFSLVFKVEENPLPVTFAYINAKKVSKTTVITWATASEINNAGFEVERSIDGKNFVKIGQERGSVNSNTLKTYSFIDATPENGVNYYRLKQVDLDGTTAYSSVVSVYFGTEVSAAKVTIAPVPADEYISVSFNNGYKTTAQITIIDMVGKIKYNETINVDELNYLHPIQLNELQTGVYFIKIDQADGTSETIKFIKR